MVARGLAFGDFDNDGDLDFFVLNIDQPSLLLRNDGANKNNWIQFRLVGTRSNKDGIGARVTVRSGGYALSEEKMSASSYLSQNDPRLHFGLGQRTLVDEVTVHWPSGKIQKLKGVKANQIRDGCGTMKTGSVFSAGVLLVLASLAPTVSRRRGNRERFRFHPGAVQSGIARQQTGRLSPQSRSRKGKPYMPPGALRGVEWFSPRSLPPPRIPLFRLTAGALCSPANALCRKPGTSGKWMSTAGISVSSPEDLGNCREPEYLATSSITPPDFADRVRWIAFVSDAAGTYREGSTEPATSLYVTNTEPIKGRGTVTWRTTFNLSSDFSPTVLRDGQGAVYQHAACWSLSRRG